MRGRSALWPCRPGRLPPPGPTRRAAPFSLSAHRTNFFRLGPVAYKMGELNYLMHIFLESSMNQHWLLRSVRTMISQVDRESLIRRLDAALAVGDGAEVLQIAMELGRIGRSDVARANRTNKKKTLEKACNDWIASTGVDPRKLFALATLLHESATDKRGKWRISVECALMVLRPDLSHRRGIFRPGMGVPARLRRVGDSQCQAKKDRERVAIVRKLGSAIAYSEGPLAPIFATVTARWTTIHNSGMGGAAA